MSRGVVYKPDEVWDYFLDYCEDMVEKAEEHMIAESLDRSNRIYITSSDDCTTAIIRVYDVDEDLVDEELVGEQECESVISKLYREFGMYKNTKNLFEEHRDEILDSEDNLTDAVTYFIHEAVSATVPTCRLSSIKKDLGITDEEIEEAKNHFLEYIYIKLGIDLYRPMVVQFDDKEEFFEHPYSHLELDVNKYN